MTTKPEGVQIFDLVESPTAGPEPIVCGFFTYDPHGQPIFVPIGQTTVPARTYPVTIVKRKNDVLAIVSLPRAVDPEVEPAPQGDVPIEGDAPARD